MIGIDEIVSEKYSDQSCTAIEVEKELFLYKLAEMNSEILDIKRKANTICIEKKEIEIVLRGDNLLTRKQPFKKICKKNTANKENEENIIAYTLMPHISQGGRCQINSKRATTTNYFDNPCYFFEKLRKAYEDEFDIKNPDNVETWIIKPENVIFWRIWGEKEKGYKNYLDAFCLSFLEDMREKDEYKIFFEDDNWWNCDNCMSKDRWKAYQNLLSEIRQQREEEIRKRYELIKK